MTELPTTAQLLREAGAYMDEHGKCQGLLVDPMGHVCALGAIDKVARSYSTELSDLDVMFSPAIKALDKTIRAEFDVDHTWGPTLNITRFNDVYATESEMVKAFYKAADDVEFD